MSGPCSLNMFGYPTCLLSEKKADKILKMMSGIVMLGRGDILKNEQELFDLCFNHENYDRYLYYIRNFYNTNMLFY